MMNGNADKWRVKVYVDGKQRSLPGGPWPTKEAGERALGIWNARRLLAETNGEPVASLLANASDSGASAIPSTLPSAGRLKSETPFREVYLNSLARLGGEAAMSRDRRTFYRTCITGEATTKTGEEIVGRMILGNLPVERITVEVIENWAASLLYNPVPSLRLKPATVAKWGRHLSQALKWAKRAGYIADNPMESAQVVARGEVSRTRQPRYVFTLDELWALQEAAGGHSVESLMMEVLIWTGLRQGEMRALTPESLVGRSVPLLQVSNSVNSYQGKAVLGPTKTEGSERRVPIPSRLMSRLKKHARTVGSGVPLFPSPTASDAWMRHEWLNRRFRALCNEARITGSPHDPRKGRRQPPTPHGLRATAASILFGAGATVPEVQAFLGHKQPLLTLQVYTEVKGFGDEDPILLACRGQGMSVPQILDFVYEAVLTRGVLGLREFRADDASAFDVDEWDLTATLRDEVTRVVVESARHTTEPTASPARSDVPPPVRVRANPLDPDIETRGKVQRDTAVDTSVIGTD